MYWNYFFFAASDSINLLLMSLIPTILLIQMSSNECWNSLEKKNRFGLVKKGVILRFNFSILIEVATNNIKNGKDGSDERLELDRVTVVDDEIGAATKQSWNISKFTRKIKEILSPCHWYGKQTCCPILRHFVHHFEWKKFSPLPYWLKLNKTL